MKQYQRKPARGNRTDVSRFPPRSASRRMQAVVRVSPRIGTQRQVSSQSRTEAASTANTEVPRIFRRLRARTQAEQQPQRP